VRVAPAYTSARNNLGAALVQSLRYAEAEVHLAAAVAAQPSNHMAAFNLGNALKQQGHGRSAEAVGAFRLAVRAAAPPAPAAAPALASAPSTPTAAPKPLEGAGDYYYSLGHTLLTMELPEEAARAWADGSAHFPAHANLAAGMRYVKQMGADEAV
jgi:tetratricopeptide (TPR) repeat protein